MNCLNVLAVALLIVATVSAGHLGKKDEFEECNKACPSIYEPVCGFDGSHYEIFASKCGMETANCVRELKKQQVYMEYPLNECEKFNNEKKNCQKRCTKEFKPVCGYDGKEYHTFSNACEFEVANCESGNHWKIITKTACPEQYN